MKKKDALLFLGLMCAACLLFVLDLLVGSVSLPISDLFQSDSVGHQIFVNLRLPKAITALLAGSALSLSGLMMQTLFRNPLAGPYILGISSGATLGVALLVLLGSVVGFAAGSLSTALCAILGAVGVLLVVLLVARRVQNNVSLLIVGMMLGSAVGALVNILQNFANPDALKVFIVWTFGSLQSVGWGDMLVLLPILLVGFVLCVVLTKPLNGLLLGENYATSLGIDVRRTRLLLILSTSLLAGGITAFCGPIAFVGVAVPHLARGLFATSNHRLTIPASALIGATLLLLCDILCSLFTYPLPISTISALFGAPIIIYVIIRGK